MPFRQASTKGGSSTALRSSKRFCHHGKTRWESFSVSPWPGKCLPQGMMPPSRRPRIQAELMIDHLLRLGAEGAVADDRIAADWN